MISCKAFSHAIKKITVIAEHYPMFVSTHSLWWILRQCTHLEHLDVAGNRSITGQVKLYVMYYTLCMDCIHCSCVFTYIHVLDQFKLYCVYELLYI